jgi:hypothetical protein
MEEKVELKIVEICVWPELLRQIFPISDPNGELWNEIEQGKIGVYRIKGGFVALTLTRTALHVECLEGDNRGGNLMLSGSLEILRRFAFACGRNCITCNVTALENILKKRYGFVVVGRSGNRIKMLKVLQWENQTPNNRRIPTQQPLTQPTTQQT